MKYSTPRIDGERVYEITPEFFIRGMRAWGAEDAYRRVTRALGKHGKPRYFRLDAHPQDNGPLMSRIASAMHPIEGGNLYFDASGREVIGIPWTRVALSIENNDMTPTDRLYHIEAEQNGLIFHPRLAFRDFTIHPDDPSKDPDIEAMVSQVMRTFKSR